MCYVYNVSPVTCHLSRFSPELKERQDSDDKMLNLIIIFILTLYDFLGENMQMQILKKETQEVFVVFIK